MAETQILNNGLVQFSVQLEKLGAELCTIRQSLNISQSYLAEWLGCDRRKIAEIESGKSHDFELIFKYCDKFSIDLTISFEVN